MKNKLLPIILFLILAIPAKSQSVYINNQAAMHISKDTYLNVVGNFENSQSGTLGIYGKLTVSEAFGNFGNLTVGAAGSVVDVGQQPEGTQPAIAELEITNTKIHLVSSPVKGALAESFTGAFVSEYREQYSKWNPVQKDAQLTQAKGFAVQYAVPTILKFNRPLSSGNIDIIINKAGDGFNLLGNPYPSQIDCKLLDFSAANLDGTVYFWNGNSYDTYIIETNQKTGMASNLIAKGQAFFVKANATGGQLTFTNAARVHGNQAFLKSERNTNFDYLKLLVKNADFSDEIYINFIDGATNGLDPKFDAVKLFSSNKQMPQLFSWLPDNSEEMVFNSLPLLTENKAIDLGFRSEKAGVYQLIISEKELQNNPKTILEDLKTGTFTQLQANEPYNFVHADSKTDSRFRLHIGNATTGIAEQEENLQVYAHLNNVYVITEIANTYVEVYTITGQKIMSTNLQNIGINKLPLHVTGGIYMVQVQQGNKTIQQKISIQ